MKLQIIYQYPGTTLVSNSCTLQLLYGIIFFISVFEKFNYKLLACSQASNQCLSFVVHGVVLTSQLAADAILGTDNWAEG